MSLFRKRIAPTNANPAPATAPSANAPSSVVGPVTQSLGAKLLRKSREAKAAFAEKARTVVGKAKGALNSTKAAVESKTREAVGKAKGALDKTKAALSRNKKNAAPLNVSAQGTSTHVQVTSQPQGNARNTQGQTQALNARNSTRPVQHSVPAQGNAKNASKQIQTGARGQAQAQARAQVHGNAIGQAQPQPQPQPQPQRHTSAQSQARGNVNAPRNSRSQTQSQTQTQTRTRTRTNAGTGEPTLSKVMSNPDLLAMVSGAMANRDAYREMTCTFKAASP